MAGHSSLPGADCVYLSALPAIHVLASQRKTWMPGTRPGMTRRKCRVEFFQMYLQHLCFSRGVLGIRGLITQAAEFAFVSDLQFEKPGLAGGVGIDQRRLGRERIVDFKYFARDRRVDVGRRLDRLYH